MICLREQATTSLPTTPFLSIRLCSYLSTLSSEYAAIKAHDAVNVSSWEKGFDAVSGKEVTPRYAPLNPESRVVSTAAKINN